MASFPVDLPPDVGVELWTASPPPELRDDGTFGRRLLLVGNPGFILQTIEDSDQGSLEKLTLIALQPLSGVDEQAFFAIVTTFLRQILWVTMPEPNEELLTEREAQLAAAINGAAVTIGNTTFEVAVSPGQLVLRVEFGEVS